MDSAVFSVDLWGAEFGLAWVSLEYGVEGVYHGDEGEQRAGCELD